MFYFLMLIGLSIHPKDNLKIISQADHYYNIGDYQKAEELYTKAYRSAIESSNIEIAVYSESKLSLVYVATMNFGKAKEIIQDAYQRYLGSSIRNDTLYAYILHNYGVYYDYSGKPDSALYYLNLALEQRKSIYDNEHKRLVNSYRSIGEVYRYHYDDHINAEYFFNKALEMVRNLHLDNKEMADLYYNLAAINITKGDFDQAITLANQAFKFFEQNNSKDFYHISLCYGLLATCYHKKGDYRRAIDLNLKTINTILQNNVTTNILADYYDNQSLYYLDMGLPDSVIRYCSQGKMFHPEPMTLSRILIHEALAYRQKGDFDNSQKQIKKSMQILNESGIDNYLMVARFHNELAKNEYLTGHLDKALIYYERTYNIFKDKTEGFAVFPDNIPSSVDLISEIALFFQEYYNNKKHLEYLIRSVKLYLFLDKMINNSRDQFARESSGLLWAQRSKEIYESALNSLYSLYGRTGQDSLIFHSLKLIESNKSFLLNKTIRQSLLRKYHNIPDSIYYSQQQINSQLAYFQTELAKQDNYQLGNNEIQTKIWNLQMEKDNLKYYIEKNHPQYAKLDEENALNLDQIKERLSQEKALILDFFVGNSNLFVVVIDKHDLRLAKLEMSELLLRYIDSYVASFYSNVFDNSIQNYEEFVASAYYLYAYIIRPIVDINQAYNKLYVVPDGKLYHIPFEAIIKSYPGEKKVDFKHLDYLLNYFDFSYLISLSNFQLEDRTVKNPAVQYYGYGIGDSKKSVDLIHTHIESRQVKKIFLLDEYLDEEASESVFKQKQADANILHLALHGRINHEFPYLSSLEFRTSNDTESDGMLYLYELYGLVTGAELVILNACETGSGRISEGEGIYNLARGFQYSGSKSQIIALWNLNDQSTSSIFNYFYFRLSTGIPIISALNSAKRDYLKTTDNISSHPKFWAASIAYGYTATDFSIEEKRSPLKHLILLSGILIAILLFRWFFVYIIQQSQ